MIKQAINIIVEGNDLTAEQATEVMHELMSGNVDEVTIATFLTALRMKGESVDEITAFTNVLRHQAVTATREVVDIVGTGGDSANTFNISTTTAFVVAAAGIGVAKHGNRSVSSKSGSADVLDALGVNIHLSAEQAQRVLDDVNMTFMFAPAFHSSMKHVASTRSQMKIRTVFNVLGPLLNPALADFQLMGVYSKDLVEPMAQVLDNLGLTQALVVHGSDGLDEVTLTGKTYACEVTNGMILSYNIDPLDYGFELCQPEDLVGGDAEQNAVITKGILSGDITGPKRDIVILNAGVGIYIASHDADLHDCVAKAKEVIDSGLALAKLEQLVEATNAFK